MGVITQLGLDIMEHICSPLQVGLAADLRKVPLRCTPHFMAYHLESKTYAVVTSTSENTDKVTVDNVSTRLL